MGSGESSSKNGNAVKWKIPGLEADDLYSLPALWLTACSFGQILSPSWKTFCELINCIKRKKKSKSVSPPVILGSPSSLPAGRYAS
jgi:hypothetical protein